MTAKQLKRNQQNLEGKIKPSDTVRAFWSYKDAFENEKTFSAPAKITEINTDHIIASLISEMQNHYHIIIYPKNWQVYLPKTNNSDRNINNRFEI